MDKWLVASLFFFSGMCCAMEEGESPESLENVIEKYLEELLEEVKSIKKDVQEITKEVVEEKKRYCRKLIEEPASLENIELLYAIRSFNNRKNDISQHTKNGFLTSDYFLNSLTTKRFL